MANEDISQFTRLASKYAVLDKVEEKRLITLAQNGDTLAWNKLVRHNFRLVIHYAKKYVNQGLDFEDLIQEGLIGLCIAIHKFDTSRGALSTYATWWIRQAITRALDNTSRPIRIPIHKLNEFRVVRRVYREFVEKWSVAEEEYEEDGEPQERTGATPTADELAILIAKAAEIDPKKRLKNIDRDEIEFLGRMLMPVTSLDKSHSDDENLSALDFLAAETEQQPEVLAEDQSNKIKLLDKLKLLDEDDRIFVMLKFGLADGRERDRKQMSAFKKMTEADAQKRLDSILAKLRKLCTREEFNV